MLCLPVSFVEDTPVCKRCVRPFATNTGRMATVLAHLCTTSIPCVVSSYVCPLLHHPFPSPYTAWPCLVWCWQGVWQGTVRLLVAGRISAESPVMDSSRSSCTCHWLSSRLSEVRDERGQAGGREETLGGVRSVCT